jgi:hypothetical protein
MQPLRTPGSRLPLSYLSHERVHLYVAKFLKYVRENNNQELTHPFLPTSTPIP